MENVDYGTISAETLQMLIRDEVQKSITSTGVSLTSGLNFYYLESAVKTLIPVYHPILNRIPRYVPTIAGQPVGGDGVHYKALTDIDTDGYPGIPESARAPFISFTEEDFYVPYRSFGKDGYVTFQAEQGGLGLDDNIRLTQWALLASLLNDIEREILFGNSGPNADNSGSGFALGSTVQPTLAASASAVSGASLSTSDYFKVWCVPLTGWGMRRAVGTTGLTPSSAVTTADGTAVTIPNGSGIISSASSEATVASGHALEASVTAVAGAVGYAWYLSAVTTTGGEATSNAYFVGTSNNPTIQILAAPSASNQAANATGLDTDNSYSQYDMDGLISLNAFSQGASQAGYWKDLGGAGFTANGDGSIVEFETLLQSQFVNYQITFDEVWCSADTIGPISTAILKATGGGAQASRLNFFTDEAGKLVGGTLIGEYRSRYSPQGGAQSLPVMMHPWLPNGTVLFVTIKNPYPEAANAIPSVLRIPMLLDFFSIKWPYRQLRHELGVYLVSALQNYIPFGHALITGAT